MIISKGCGVGGGVWQIGGYSKEWVAKKKKKWVARMDSGRNIVTKWIYTIVGDKITDYLSGLVEDHMTGLKFLFWHR